MPEDTISKKFYSSFFRKKFPADLKLVMVWLAASIIAIFIPFLNHTPVRFVLALPVLLFITGYSLISALFPKEGDIDPLERFVLSFGLSIVITSLIGLGLNFTPWGIRLEPVVISLTLFALVMILFAHYTRTRLPENEQFRVPFAAIGKGIHKELFAPGENRVNRFLSVILTLSILMTLLTALYVIALPREGEHFTEFFILGSNRTAAEYPLLNIAGQNYPIYVGIGNHEYRNTTYTVETWLLRTEFDNVTNRSRIRAMDPNDRLILSLSHNETRIIPYNFSVKNIGYDRVEFLLFNEIVPEFELTGSDRINASYRNLHLIFRVEEKQEEYQDQDIMEQTIITS